MNCSEGHLVDYIGRCYRCGASPEEIRQQLIIDKVIESNNKLSEAIEKLIKYLDSH